MGLGNDDDVGLAWYDGAGLGNDDDIGLGWIDEHVLMFVDMFAISLGDGLHPFG